MSACSKEFTLHVDPGAVCPTFDGAVALAGVAGMDIFPAGFLTSTDVLNPNKYFCNLHDGAQKVAVVNADSRTVIASFVPLHVNFLNDAIAVESAHRFYFGSQDGALLSYVESVHADTHAQASTGAFAANESVEWLTYDEANGELVVLTETDVGAFSNWTVYRLNPVTLATIASFLLPTAVGPSGLINYRGIAYDSVRDRYLTSWADGFNFPPVYELRVFDRTTGALAGALPYADETYAPGYVDTTDRVYFMDNTNVAQVVHPGTLVIEDTIALADHIYSGRFHHWAAKGMILSTGNGLLWTAVIKIPENTYICGIAGTSCAPGFNGATEVAVRQLAIVSPLWLYQ